MRLIDADALKKDLTRFYDNEITAKRLIDEQPTIEPKTNWIKCSERLPEEGLAVLTYRENGDYEVNWLDFDGKWFWEDVVAWMPLPACYKPQERSEE